MRGVSRIVVGCVLVVLCLVGCGRTQRAFNQVLVDFRLRPAPETEEPDLEADIMSRLEHITERELARFNTDPANTEVKFEEIPDNPVGLGHFYKIATVYEKAYPLEVTKERVPQVQHAETLRQRGYRARVEYRYRVFRGTAFPTREEARGSVAEIRTDEVGREIYTYDFDEAGVWDGEPGRLERRFKSTEAGAARLPNPLRDDDGDGTPGTITVGGSLRLRGERGGAVEK
jgi:hypothetical protein